MRIWKGYSRVSSNVTKSLNILLYDTSQSTVSHCAIVMLPETCFIFVYLSHSLFLYFEISLQCLWYSKSTSHFSFLKLLFPCNTLSIQCVFF